MAVLLLCEAKKGMSAKQLERTLGISYKTSWYLCHRIRAAMATAEKTMLDGTIERRNPRRRSSRKRERLCDAEPRKRLSLVSNNVVGSFALPDEEDVEQDAGQRFIKDNVSEDVDVIMTDEFCSYPFALDRAGVSRDKHKTIKHKNRVYVDGIHHDRRHRVQLLSSVALWGSWHKQCSRKTSSRLP